MSCNSRQKLGIGCLYNAPRKLIGGSLPGLFDLHFYIVKLLLHSASFLEFFLFETFSEECGEDL